MPSRKLLEHWALLKDILDSALVLGKSHGIPLMETMQYIEYVDKNEYLLAWDELYELGRKHKVINVSFWENMALAARKMI